MDSKKGSIADSIEAINSQSLPPHFHVVPYPFLHHDFGSTITVMGADGPRGSWLEAQRTLEALEKDPQQLHRARMRFSYTPPPYISQSHNSTLSQSPTTPPSEEQRRLEERRWRLIGERRESLPYDQLAAQTREEMKRIVKADEDHTCTLPVGADPHKISYGNIKKRWVEQGIWNDQWNSMASGALWKHEEPLELESELETETKRSLFSLPTEEPRPKSDEESRRIAERRATLERERQASRPLHQFVYQVSKERERIQDELESGEVSAVATSDDINTRAYENVKNTWTKRCIWNTKWGILPGMSWKHESSLEALEEEIANDSAPIQANLPENGGHDEIGEAPPARLFGSPHLVGSPLCHIPLSQEYGTRSAPLRGLSADIDLFGLANGDIEHTSLELKKSPPSRDGRVDPRHTTRRATRRSTRKTSSENGQTQAIWPANLSMVPKDLIRQWLQLFTPIARPSTGPLFQLFPEPSIAESLLQSSSKSPPRSQRLQSRESITAKDPGGIASTDSAMGVSRPRPKRLVTDNPKSDSSAKPQGISKSQRSRPTRQKAKKCEK